MLKNRIELFRASKDGVKNNIQPFTGTADEFLIKYFTGDLPTESKYKNKISGIDTNSGWFFARFDLAKRRGDFSGDLEQYYREYACDLVNQSGAETLWKKETIEYCKPPEPIKKLTPIEIIEKYANAMVWPFVDGEVVKNETGDDGYYAKEGINQGRLGEFRYGAPDKEGNVLASFYVDKKFKQKFIRKVERVIHESKRKKKNISERFERDLKVLHLLKEVSRINKTKKNLVLENNVPLNPAQAKAELQKLMANFFSNGVDFLNQIQMEDYTSQIIDLLKNNYKGRVFGAFRRAIYLASITIPGESGEDTPDAEKTERYAEMLAELNAITDTNLFRNPTTTEIENGKYESILPESIRELVKPGLKVYRTKSDAPATGNTSTYRTRSATPESCQTELRTIYSEAQGTFRNNKDYCKSQTFQDRKDYLVDCYNKSYFKKTANIVTANKNRFYQMYEQLYRGVLTNRDGGTTRLPNECAFKN
jgi:hypothetical protein